MKGRNPCFSTKKSAGERNWQIKSDETDYKPEDLMQPENIQVVLPFPLNSRNMMKFDSVVELSLKQ